MVGWATNLKQIWDCPFFPMLFSDFQNYIACNISSCIWIGKQVSLILLLTWTLFYVRLENYVTEYHDDVYL